MVCLAFAIAEAVLLDVRIRDFDEGVYWQSIRALARGEPLFGSVFASQPPGFYYLLLPLYLIGRSVASLRLSVLIFALIGLIATYLVGRLSGGRVAGLIAVGLAATSPLYFHQSAIVQADGPSVALSIAAVCLAMFSVRADRRRGAILAFLAGAVLATAIGVKFLSAVTLVPVAMVLLTAATGRRRLVATALAGGIVGMAVVLVPTLAWPSAAYNQLITGHLRAGQLAQQSLVSSLEALFLRRELPLEALAVIAAVVALIRRDQTVLIPLVWAGASVLAALLYHPLFPHHLVMLSVPLALVVSTALNPHPDPPPERGRETALQGEREILPTVLVAALVLATAGAGAGAIAGEMQLSIVPDGHDAEMAAAVRAVSRPGDFWISDNPWAIALADRDLPGPLVDTASQRIRSGLLTVNDLEMTRRRYRVRWLLEDSFRLYGVPNYPEWLFEHFHAVRSLGGGAVVYQAN
jgi:hypothetical protein